MSRIRDLPQRAESEVRRAAGAREAFSNPNPNHAENFMVNDQEDHVVENQFDVPPPPPPPVDLATILDRQNRILELLANAMLTPNNHGNGNDQHTPPSYTHKIVDFHRLHSPKFGGSDNPLEADDWLREIEMKLEVVHASERDKVLLAVQQLTGLALAWWQSYKEINPEARTMIWDDFVKLFREHHIPNSMMKLKRQEFLSLQQRNLSVTEYLHKFIELSRYAPYEVDNDEKK
jgi:hypothetical protein